MITLCNKCDYYRNCYDDPEFCYTHELLQKIENLECRNIALNEIEIKVGDMVKSSTNHEDSFVHRGTNGLVLGAKKCEDGSSSLFVQWEDSKIKGSDHRWYINSRDVVKL